MIKSHRELLERHAMAVNLEAIRQVETGSNGHQLDSDLVYFLDQHPLIIHHLLQVIPQNFSLNFRGLNHYPVGDNSKGYLQIEPVESESGQMVWGAYGYRLTLTPILNPEKPFDVYLFAGQNKNLIFSTSTGRRQPIHFEKELDLKLATQSLSTDLHRTYDPATLALQEEIQELIEELKRRAYENSLQAQLDRHQNA